MIKRKSYLRETQYARRGKCSRQAKKMTTKKYPYTFKGLKDNEVIKYWILQKIQHLENKKNYGS